MSPVHRYIHFASPTSYAGGDLAILVDLLYKLGASPRRVMETWEWSTQEIF
jgi:hypothetical protein